MQVGMRDFILAVIKRGFVRPYVDHVSHFSSSRAPFRARLFLAQVLARPQKQQRTLPTLPVSNHPYLAVYLIVSGVV